MTYALYDGENSLGTGQKIEIELMIDTDLSGREALMFFRRVNKQTFCVCASEVNGF